MQAPSDEYPARLDIEYVESLNRISTLLRPIYILPIVLLAATIPAALTIPVVLMLLVRRKCPRWWFDFNLELTRFQQRVTAYANLMTDQYPSTDEEQTVRVDLDYPDAQRLSRWLPLVKWLLALPHYLVLYVLGMLAGIAVVITWVVILVTGRYPRPLFSLVLGYERWNLRVAAYASLLTTDRYPPFRFGP
jgi:hypothetical protein